MRIILLSVLLISFHSFVNGQTVTEFYNEKNYDALVKFGGKSDSLKPEEIYMVGFAFFRVGNDKRAVEFYDKAIDKGFNQSKVHFYKGVVLRYLSKYDEAIKEVEIALESEPENQMFMNEKGLIYYDQNKLDESLGIFEQSKKLPNTSPDLYYWIARIYHKKEEISKALTEYYVSVEMMHQESSYYIDALKYIGLIEYKTTRDYLKSAKAYSAAINIEPKNYILYPKLIKSYNAAKEYVKADSIFSLMKIAYENKELSKDEMEFKNIQIDESEWEGQKMIVSKYLVDPINMTDVFYKVYLLSRDDKNIVRTFMVERCPQIGDGAKYLLCERDKKTDAHYTYLYGWNKDYIPLDELKKAVGLVLDGTIKPGASSSFGKQ